MKRILCLLTALFLTAGAYAQTSSLPRVSDIAEVETDSGQLSLFSMRQEDSPPGYYLCVGTLGIGDEVFQVHFDPLFKLFIHLGGTLSEALETLRLMQAHFKEPKGTVLDLNGSFSPAFPREDRVETVTVTSRKGLLSRYLEFSLEREGYIRATYVYKSDLNAIVSGAKFYRRLHPKEP